MNTLNEGQNEEANRNLHGPEGDVGKENIVLGQPLDREHLLPIEKLEMTAESLLNCLNLQYVRRQVENLGVNVEQVSILGRDSTPQERTHKRYKNKVIRGPELDLCTELCGNSRRSRQDNEDGED